MKIFKQHKDLSALPDKAAGRIACLILKVQSGFAAWMSKLSGDWTRKQQWVFLVCTCTVFIVLSIVAVVKPFASPTARSAAGPAPIAIPKPLPKEIPRYAITETEFRRVQQYKQRHPQLQQERPGLFDSLTLIEQLYYSQQK